MAEGGETKWCDLFYQLCRLEEIYNEMSIKEFGTFLDLAAVFLVYVRTTAV